ncbi:hybrid sensor histidine kinase/response regulator transcription factor [Ohtaekwangia koreensis]|uniref:histidine kinase n=1 Tax=Ohtaekwangia koreensis TaxID=688867 RepID=A0A1T5MC69_9BACT|nr:hybrid sensor histidine kinase/response regulator transcription factor [Ohtaekwangia koreensis]SKC85479.1 ligand-binding sensor domain-containing protein [Ohtaekwangia koreensis]
MNISFSPAIYKSIGILYIVLSSFCSWSQVHDYRFRHITRNDGLSQSNVTCIIQDRDGFMWFGTRDGLNKYDGYKITIYRNDPSNPGSISHNYIRALYEDSKHRLWVGTEDGGMSLYNRERDDFSNYMHNPHDTASISSNKVKAIAEDSHGILWIGTGGGGLNRFDPAKNTFRCYRHAVADKHSISGNDIEDILEDSKGNLWIATWNAGLNSFNPALGKFSRYRATPHAYHTLSSDFLKMLFIDSDQNLWIGTTEGGLNRYDRRSNTFIQYRYTPGNPNGLSNNDVLSITEDAHGNLWIGTQNGGINILDRKNRTFSYITQDEKYPEGLNNGSVYSLYRDRQGNMWAGTFSGGVNFLDSAPPKFRHFTNDGTRDGLNNENVLSIYEDASGNIYLGTDGGGLNMYNKRQKRFAHLLHDPRDKNSIRSNYPLCMYEDHNKNLWIGCFYGKAAIFDRHSNRFHTILSDTDIKHVSSICEDTVSGKIWMGTWGDGLVVYDKDTGKFSKYIPDLTNPHTISSSIIFCIYQDRAGQLWIGTEGGGLNLYNREKNNFIRFQSNTENRHSISSNIVNTIYEDRHGNLWIGTNGGLNLYTPSTKSFIHYTISDGLPNNVIQAITEDGKGNLWLSTNKGISKFNPQKKTFRNYEITDGSQSNSFNRQSSFKNDNGDIYFGGVNGLTYFHPDSIQDNDFTPPVYFTELQVFNKPVNFRDEGSPLSQPISEAKEVILSYKQSVFSLEFVALNYSLPEKNQYAYKLEGFDDDWNYVGTQRKATYTNLDPGSYILRVKASNNDGVWNDQGNTLRIIITPPFWKTWWAKVTYIIILLAFLFFLRQVLVQRMKVRNRLEMDEIKLRFYANISHEFRTPLTLILGPLNHLTTSSTTFNAKEQQLIQLMHRNGENLLKLINQLMHIYELDAGFMKLKVMKSNLVTFTKGIKETFQFTAEKRNIQYQLISPIQNTECYFDPDKLEKILLNLISNAFKYTPDHGAITIKLSFHEDIAEVPAHILKKKKYVKSFVCIQVADNGAGISTLYHDKVFDPFFRVEKEQQSKEGTGIGLALARQLAIVHYGDILLESTIRQGCKFSVWLPVGKEAFDKDEISITEYDFENRLQDSQTTYGILESKITMEPVPNENDARPVLLVVDDNHDIRQFLKLNFDSTFQITEAENGEDGFKKACDLIPDIILSDVMMPVQDGVEMCSQLKNDIRTNHIPVVLLTARVDEDFQLNAFKIALADDYIAKPFSANILLAKLCNILELRENLKKKYYRDCMMTPSAPTASTPSLNETFLKKAVEAVETNIDDPDYNVEKFCRDLGMSQTNLYRKLQSLLGISGNQFIKDIRMKRALQLLSQGQYPVHEIAGKVGFADAKYFSKSFKKQFGVLPSAYSLSEKKILH